MRVWRVLPAVAAVVALTVGVILGGSAAGAGSNSETLSATRLLAAAAAAPAAGAAAVTWGSNDAGQLGAGGTADISSVPVDVTTSGVLSGKTLSAVSAGTAHACAVSSGAGYCWGLNGNGQLGNGTKTDSNVAVPVTSTGVLSGKTVTAISAGFAHTCAIAGGAAYCWGSNADGVLGNGSVIDSSTPVAVTATGALAGKTVTAISAGRSNTCAIADGAAYCWGYAGFGALGSGTVDSAMPIAVTGALSGKKVTAISVGTVSETSVCAVADGGAYCWGSNTYGQIGDGTTTAQNAPVAVSLGAQPVTDIAAGGFTTCAVAGGNAYCWGLNEFGELGNGTTTNSLTPVAVTTSGALSGKTVSAVSVGTQITGNKVHPGFAHTCAVAGGAPVCWGANQYGQLGSGSAGLPSLVPVAVSTADALSGQSVADVASGGVFSAAVTFASGALVSLAPSRILDTRSGLGGSGPVAPKGTISLQVLGQNGIPASGVSAVVLNVTVSAPVEAGYITVWPSGEQRQATSNVPFVKGQNGSNLVIVPVGADGKVQFFNGSTGTTKIVADVAGYVLGV